MGGGLMQLVAYGAQDIYLTGNPQITFFKVVYRRHTNFSMESIKQTFNGTTGFGKEVSATISRNGDLVYRMYLEHDVTFSCTGEHTYVVITSNYGNNLIKNSEIEIGGQTIDKHYSHWNNVYSQLTEFNPTNSFNNGFDHSDSGFLGLSGGDVKRSTLFNTMSGNGGLVTTGISNSNITAKMGSWDITANDTGQDLASTKIFLPLNFWFNRNPGLALPLIALQYHEVKVKMTFENISNLVKTAVESSISQDSQFAGSGVTSRTTFSDATVSGTPKFNLWCDYIYLDTDERRRFAQVSHEYLIEQLQFQSFSSSTSMELNFNHPVKELIWTSSKSPSNEGGAIVGQSIDNFIPNGEQGGQGSIPDQVALSKCRVPDNLSGNFHIKLNGHDRFKERDAKYFTKTQVWEHHTGTGSMISSTDAIAVYSFALKPEEHQPSGTCNFSRIDNAELKASVSGNYYVYAVNYNVLRIMSGMGGLAYSN